MHIREAEIAALILECEPLVIEPEQVQHRRIQVMHMHGIGGDIEAKLIRAPVAHAARERAVRRIASDRLWRRA